MIQQRILVCSTGTEYRLNNSQLGVPAPSNAGPLQGRGAEAGWLVSALRALWLPLLPAAKSDISTW